MLSTEKVEMTDSNRKKFSQGELELTLKGHRELP